MRTVLISLLLLSFFIYPATAAANNTDVAKDVIRGGLDAWIIGNADDMIKDSDLTAVEENSTEANINIFSAATTPVDINDQVVRAKSESTIPIFEVLAKDLLFVLALFILLQIAAPGTAADLTELVNGRATYYRPKDLFNYGISVCGWFAGGPGFLLGMLLLSNWLTGDMDTSVLNQLVISTENTSSYITLAFCSKGIKYYFSIRAILIMYVREMWYLIGLVLAFKKTRWIGIIFIGYTAAQIFVQPLIVSILTETVGYVLNGSMNWFSDMVVYGGMTILLAGICGITLTLPVWIELFRPGTMKATVHYLRYAI